MQSWGESVSVFTIGNRLPMFGKHFFTSHIIIILIKLFISWKEKKNGWTNSFEIMYVERL